MTINVTELVSQSSDFVLFEDDWAVVLFNEQAMTLGHLRVFPKAPLPTLDSLSSEQSLHLFTIASKCATLLFEGMKCHGTNVIVKDGDAAENPYDRVCIEAIARFENDGLDMFWTPNPGDQAEIGRIGGAIKDAIVIGGPVKSKGITQVAAAPVEDEEQKFWDEQFRRIP